MIRVIKIIYCVCIYICKDMDTDCIIYIVHFRWMTSRIVSGRGMGKHRRRLTKKKWKKLFVHTIDGYISLDTTPGFKLTYRTSNQNCNLLFENCLRLCQLLDTFPLQTACARVNYTTTPKTGRPTRIWLHQKAGRCHCNTRIRRRWKADFERPVGKPGAT